MVMLVNGGELAAALDENAKLFVENKVLREAVKAIRASDCGAWQKDCMGGLFRCSDGRAKRMELGRLLDQLYKVVGI